jgi:thiosulfate dehydrogenase [quinone] large subunit
MAVNVQTKNNPIVRFEDPPFTKSLFGDVRFSWIWLILRVYIGYQWLMAGWEKIQNPVWFGSKAGVALSGFLNNALTKAAGEHPDVQGWYAGFIQNVVLPNAPVWSTVVSIGELLVGIGLVLGAFTGIAAFFAGFMNVNYLLAGTVSTNPTMFILALLVFLAWKTAGWVGLDRWLLPILGTPWRPGKVFKKEIETEA